MADRSSANQAPRGFSGLTLHALQNKIDVTLWFTRLLNIVFTFLYFVPIFRSQVPAYQKALLSCAVTSALRLYQRQPQIRLTADYIMQALAEDSFHYLAFCLLFVSVRQISLALVPMALFSVLHFTSYSLTFMDILGPNSLYLLRFCIHIVEFQSTNILNLIAISEIILMPYLVFLALFGQVAFTTVFIYYQFLIMRCRSRRNPCTRNVFHSLRLQIDNFARRPYVPLYLHYGLLKFTYYISKLGLYSMNGQ